MVKNQPANSGDRGSIPVSEDPLEEDIATHSSILPGKSHRQRSLAVYSPWGHKESDTSYGVRCVRTDTESEAYLLYG